MTYLESMVNCSLVEPISVRRVMRPSSRVRVSTHLPYHTHSSGTCKHLSEEVSHNSQECVAILSQSEAPETVKAPRGSSGRIPTGKTFRDRYSSASSSAGNTSSGSASTHRSATSKMGALGSGWMAAMNFAPSIAAL